MPLGGFGGLDHADARVNRPVGPAGAFAGAVLVAEIERVDLQFFTDLINDGFRGESGIGGARSAISRRSGLINHNIVAVDVDVWYVVASEDAHGPAAHGRASKRASFIAQRT